MVDFCEEWEAEAGRSTKIHLEVDSEALEPAEGAQSW